MTPLLELVLYVVSFGTAGFLVGLILYAAWKGVRDA
jgi:hypothetical protein